MSGHPLEQLSPYLDGELAPREAAAVAAHLEVCSDCTERMAEMAALDAVARRLPTEAPAGYFDTFPARVRARLPGRSAAIRRLPVWALAAAAVLLVAVITPLTLRERSVRPSVAEIPAARQPLPAATAAPQAEGQPARGLGYVSVPDGEGVSDKGERRDGGRTRSKPAAGGEAGLAKRTTEPPAAPPAAPAPAPVPALVDQRPSAQAPTPAAVKGRGPWFQGQTQSPATPAPPAPSLAAVQEEERSLEAKADQAADSERAAPDAAAGRRASVSGVARGEAGRFVEKDKNETGVEDLLRRRPQSAAEARALREAARRFAAENPSHARADELRVLVIEAGAQALGFSHDLDDRTQVEADAAAYLARSDAAQAARVRAVLASLSR